MADEVERTTEPPSPCALAIERILGPGPLATVVVDGGGRVVVWNRAASHLFGRAPDLTIGRRLQDLDLADDGATAGAFATVLGDGAARLIDLYGRPERRAAFTARLAVSALPGVDGFTGASVGAIGLALDLTHHAENERQLAELTAEVSAQAGILHAILDHVPADLHLLDADGRFVFVGPGNVAGIAFEADRLLGRPVGDLPAPPSLRVELERLRRRVVRFGSGDRSEVDVTVGTGRRTLELDLRPVRGAGGVVTGTLVCIRDISSRRAQEAALERAYVRQSQLIANTPLGVIEWDRDYRIRRWSSQAEVVFGWTAQEALGRRLDDLRLVHPDDLRRTALANAALMDSELRHNVVEQRNLTQARDERFCRWHNSIVRSGDDDDLTVLSLVEDLTEQEATRQRIRALAENDPLTGLLNRTLFRDRLDQALARSRRLRNGGALILVDLDHFKDVNDTYGHSAGDTVLIEVARKMTGAVRESDTVARLGGDEFALVISDLETPEAAGEVAQKILDRLAGNHRIEDDEVAVGASMGVVLFPDDATDADDLVNKADVALYRAKGWGRRRCVFYRPGMNRRVEQRRQLTQDLRLALESGALELHYQPQFAVADGRLLGAEALLRWRHPTRGLLTPASFLEVAERSGAIRQIGPMVVERACRQARAWLDLRPDLPLRISLNVSRTEWLRSDLVTLVLGRIDELRLPPGTIEIDVVEAVLSEIALPRGSVEPLTAHGIAIALDSFGGEPSRLHSLALPSVRRVKIASELLRAAGSDPARLAIMEAITSLAHRLGKDVVATGVARAAERDLAEAAGCDVVQGSLLARPMPASELTALLLDANPAHPDPIPSFE